MSKLTAEQRVQRAHVWLMKNPKYCLYSGIFMIGRTEVNDTASTAATDGRNVFYGRKFVDGLDDMELRALVLHENLHKAFRHLTTWRHLYDKDAQLANMACDYVINLMIHDSDPDGTEVRLPEGGCLDEQYRGLDAGEVFRRLQKQGGGGGGGGGGSLDQHDWEAGESMSNDEKEQLAKDVDQALRQGKILAGKMKGDIPREVTDALASKVDWREALREFVTSFCTDRDESTWRRPNRRWLWQDVYMPSSISESIGRIVVAIDMSGSIGDAEIGQFLGEIKSICETVSPEGIDLLYWDTRVCQHEKYERDQLGNLLQTTKPRGRGGTDPQCIPDYIKAHRLKPECAVILTDGVVPRWGDGWACPTLWGITTDTQSAVGKSIRVG
jgi:predicted metal-dependent peptidase